MYVVFTPTNGNEDQYLIRNNITNNIANKVKEIINKLIISGEISTQISTLSIKTNILMKLVVYACPNL